MEQIAGKGACTLTQQGEDSGSDDREGLVYNIMQHMLPYSKTGR